MKLKLSNNLSLPIEAITQTFAILAKKGSGKSYLASVMAEEMLKLNQQIIVLDPTGAWWGLQSSSDGSKEGFPVVVFGGDHGNIELDESSGEVIAQAIVEQKFSAVIDLSLLRKGASNRFVGVLLETLYRINRQPVHLFVDEADAFAPQKTFGDDARTLGAMEDIVRRGRKRGIGCTMITQRPAVINKNVLTQCEVLLALRMNHPKDINSIMEWVNVHADAEPAKAMIQSLPSLPIGTAWIWSPGWMDIFKRFEVRKRETFDSGATPTPGVSIKLPKRLAQIDIKILGEQINQTIERKKADSPVELKKRVADLEKQLKVKSEVANDNALQDLRTELLHANREIKYLNDIINVGRAALNGSYSAKNNSEESIPLNITTEKLPVTSKKFYQVKSSGPSIEKFSGHMSSNITMGKCERAILIVLAQRTGSNSSKNQIGILAGYSPSSGGFNNSISKLRQNNFIEGSGDALRITDDGLIAVGNYEPLPTGDDLHKYWYGKLNKCEATILEYLVNKHPDSSSKEVIGIETNYSHTSGGFNNSLSRLRTLELIEGYKEIKASDNLF